MDELLYATAEGKEKKASVIPVDLSLEGLSDEEIQVIGHLSEASNGFTPIFAQQNYDRVLEMYSALLDLEQQSGDPKVREALANYNTLFAACDSFWLGTEDVALRFPLQRSQIPKDHPLREFSELLMQGAYPPRGRGLYPVGIGENDIDSLADALRENTSVVRDTDSYTVKRNEERFRHELQPVIAQLQKAKQETSNTSLREYISATMNALQKGTEAARKQVTHAWIGLDSSIDFLADTGVEPDLDQIKGVQGCAMSVVGYLNNAYQDLSDSLIGLMEEFEQKAPWNNKREVGAHNAPKLRFMDVVTFCGGYEPFPATVMAQTLPNDEGFTQSHGCVDYIFTNIQEALGKDAGRQFVLEEMLPRKVKNYEKDALYMRLLMSTTHEIGHRLGSYRTEDGVIDEGKAELFAMWSLPLLLRKGIITEEQEIAGYYEMMNSMIKELQMQPSMHSGARNMMFHYFFDNEAIVEREEDGRMKYTVNTERMRDTVSTLLGYIGDMGSSGDAGEEERLKEQYIRDRKDEFGKRMEGCPQGRVLLFPTMQKKNGRYTGELVYPDTYRGQARTLNNFV